MAEKSMLKMRRRTKLVLLISLTNLTAVTYASITRANDLTITNNPKYKEAYARLDVKDYSGALIILNELLKQNTNSGGIYYALGKAHQELGNNKAALVDYTNSIKLDPLNLNALTNRGLVQGALGNLKAAMADFNKAISINPRYESAYLNRGVTRGALGDLKGAISDFNRAISINNRYSAAWRNRGITRELGGDMKGACEDWRKAASLGQAEAVSWVKAQC